MRFPVEVVFKERRNVEIDDYEVAKAMLALLKKKFPDYFKGDYINKEGYWEIYEYTHPHNRDDVYKRGDKATPDEIELDNHLAWLRKILS